MSLGPAFDPSPFLAVSMPGNTFGQKMNNKSCCLCLKNQSITFVKYFYNASVLGQILIWLKWLGYKQFTWLLLPNLERVKNFLFAMLNLYVLFYINISALVLYCLVLLFGVKLMFKLILNSN